MKQTSDGDLIASDGRIIPSSSHPRDLKRRSAEHAALAETYRVLADALRNGEDPTENRRYGFYQDSQGRWRDADHRELTDDGYEDPLVQAHRLAGHHQILAGDYREAASRVLSSREVRPKGSKAKVDDNSARERTLDEMISDSRRDYGHDLPAEDHRPRPDRPSGRGPMTLIVLLALLALAVYFLLVTAGLI